MSVVSNKDFIVLKGKKWISASATPIKVDRESVQEKSLGFWKGHDVMARRAKSCKFRSLFQ